MSKLLKRLILFIIMSLLGIIPMYLVDAGLRHVVRPKGFLTTWTDLYTNNINADLVIFGTSRAQSHFVSTIIADSLGISVYNLGGMALPSEIQLIRLYELLSTCTKRPKIITLEYSNRSIEHDIGLDKEYQLYPWMFNNNLYEKYTTLLYGSYSKYDFHIPLYRYRFRLINMIKESVKIWDTCERGYYNFAPERNASEWLIHHDGYRIEINPQRVEYIREFIETCINNNIKINIVYTPEYYWQNLYSNKKEFLDTIKSIATQYDIPFKDFSCDSIPINTDTIFYGDNIHLTKKGAQKFTSEYYVPFIKNLYGW